jgi:uncharacterized protein YecE (DUF72 family)
MLNSPRPARILVGTSGWVYPGWRGRFYPREIPQERWLAYYGKHFGSVEVNASFYRLPDRRTLRAWTKAAPAPFVFAVKASRYITHMKKLREAPSSLRSFVRRVATLGEQLGPILFQLPPHWRFNRERLAAFLTALDPGYRYAFEFRDRSWINDETLQLLARRHAAFCIYDLAGFRSPESVTTDFVYLRLHGPAESYRGSYDARAITHWAQAIEHWAAAGRSVYCYFDNDEHAYAAANAAQLQSCLKASGLALMAPDPRSTRWCGTP